MDVPPVFQDEAQLMSWGESNTQGPWIKLRLREPEQLNPFRGMTQAKGDRAGQRIAVVMVLIGDDEQPTTIDSPQWTPEQIDKLRAQGPAPLIINRIGGPLARLAGLWCGDRMFQRWMAQTFPPLDDDQDLTDEQLAAGSVRRVCEVASRAELDHNPEAADRFHSLIRMPYSNFLARRTHGS
jgi:hypothetical protein